MKPLITDINQLDLNKSYTVGDYLTWQFDEMVEIIKGKIFKMSPAPRSSHQAIVSNIHYKLRLITTNQKCKVYPAPFDVYLKGIEKTKDTVIQPDICIICDRSKIHEKGCVGAPDMIVEIVSPSSMKKDVDYKFHLYEENGVNEYWIVTPEFRQVAVYVLENGIVGYQHKGNFNLEDTDFVPVFTLNQEMISLKDIFEL